MGTIAENIESIQKEKAEAAERAGRNPEDILLCAVTKTHTAEQINEAIRAGVTDIGENKVQEILDKYDKVLPVRWHMIGHLQTNKVKYIIDKVCLIHSVDSFRLAEERGLQYSFRIDTATEVPHPNAVGITLAGADGHSVHVTGVSIGGGSVRLRELDGVEIDLSGEYDTIVVKQYDKPGVVAFITKTLSESGVNIAFMRLYRENRGKIAYTIVEADQPIHRETVRTIFEHPDIVAARRITPREEADR